MTYCDVDLFSFALAALAVVGVVVATAESYVARRRLQRETVRR